MSLAAEYVAKVSWDFACDHWAVAVGTEALSFSRQCPKRKDVVSRQITPYLVRHRCQQPFLVLIGVIQQDEPSCSSGGCC